MNQQTVQAPLFSIRPAYKFSRLLSLGLILAGLFISAYLLYHYININSENSTGKGDICSAVFAKSCDGALTSEMSSQLGLPLAAWGVLSYMAIIIFLIMPFLFGKTFYSIVRLLIYLLSCLAFLTAIALMVTMIIYPNLFCPFCTVIHIINIVLFFLLPRSMGINFRRFLAGLKEGLKTLFSKNLFLSASLWKAFGFLTVSFLLASGYFGLRILTLSASKEPAFIDFKPILKEYKAQPVKTIPITEDDPSIGPNDSKIQVVVFSDFFCVGCKKFSYGLKNVIDSSKGQYHIVFKNFPLDKKCNPMLKEDFHKGACDAALAAEAANRQGKFWAFHDILFTADKTANEDALKKTATSLGLNMQKFNEWRQSDSAKIKISRDIYLARQLGIDATPAVFLNGRQVKDLRKNILQALINEEIKKSAFNTY